VRGRGVTSAFVTRSRRRVYIARMEGKSAHTSTGGGGQSCGLTARRLAAPAATAAAVALTGTVDGQEKSSGTRGEVVHRTIGVREAISESGTSGKFIHACQGQRVGFSVRRVSKRSWPMNSRTANAPYVVNAKYTPALVGQLLRSIRGRGWVRSPAPKDSTIVPAQTAVTTRPECVIRWLVMSRSCSVSELKPSVS
jgi:hypothetical protein